jgi:hypothetical protein
MVLVLVAGVFVMTQAYAEWRHAERPPSLAGVLKNLGENHDLGEHYRYALLKG